MAAEVECYVASGQCGSLVWIGAHLYGGVILGFEALAQCAARGEGGVAVEPYGAGGYGGIGLQRALPNVGVARVGVGLVVEDELAAALLNQTHIASEGCTLECVGVGGGGYHLGVRGGVAGVGALNPCGGVHREDVGLGVSSDGKCGILCGRNDHVFVIERGGEGAACSQLGASVHD